MPDPRESPDPRPVSEPPRDGGQGEAAHYIMGQIEDLAALARRHRLDMLGYLLEMAQLEARDTIQRRKPSKR